MILIRVRKNSQNFIHITFTFEKLIAFKDLNNKYYRSDEPLKSSTLKKDTLDALDLHPKSTSTKNTRSNSLDRLNALNSSSIYNNTLTTTIGSNAGRLQK